MVNSVICYSSCPTLSLKMQVRSHADPRLEKYQRVEIIIKNTVQQYVDEIPVDRHWCVFEV